MKETVLPTVRMRRLRMNAQLRDLIAEHTVSVKDLILPLFIKAGQNQVVPIESMPGHSQWTVDRLEQEIAEVVRLGIPGVMLFGLPAFKDATGSAALQHDGVVQQATQSD